MKRTCGLLVFLTSLSAGIIHAQKIESFQYKGKSFNYIVQLPSNFDASKTYPVLIGPSDLEDVNDRCFYWNKTKDTFGWILIDYKIFNAVNRTDEIKALLEHLKSTYSVEDNKFHTVCFSANSAGIFDLVMAIPSYFAGITGMAGNPTTSNEENLKNLKGVKVQFVVGDQDTYWLNAANKSHQLLRELGVNSTIEIIKNGQHVMKPLIGEGFLTRANRLRK